MRRVETMVVMMRGGDQVMMLQHQVFPSTQDSADVEPTQRNEPRHSNRERRGFPPLRLIEQYLATVAEEEANQSPQSVQEALQSTHGDKWKEVMDSEMRSLKENGVFELVDRPKGKKVVKSKWVLRVKTNEKGGI